MTSIETGTRKGEDKQRPLKITKCDHIPAKPCNISIGASLCILKDQVNIFSGAGNNWSESKGDDIISKITLQLWQINIS